jgi:CDP-diacylglycerol--glycerol-3-phosphate 3-phosphatidyltransferase
LFLYLALLYYGNETALLWNTALIILIFALDGLDGWIARKRGETTLLGSVLDIATDRTLEYVLWVVFAHINLISVVVPIIVLIRGTLVDAIRSLGMKGGVSAFDQIHSSLNQFLVSSRFMRAFYGVVKTLAAVFLTLAFALIRQKSTWSDPVYLTGQILTWISVITCLARGLPVIVEGLQGLKENPVETE